jgi:hydrogenase maturation protease
MTILLCGLGNTERGDDGFGPYIIKNLGDLKKIKTMDCGMHIENYLNKIISMAPDLIILFDTVEHGPADVVLLRNEEIVANQALSITTHNLPFNSIYDYLKKQSSADIWLVGVMPRSYLNLSDSVRSFAHKVIEWLKILDNESKISILNLYETLSSTLR